MYKIIISTFLTLSLNSMLLQAENLSYSFMGTQTSVSSYNDVTAQSFGIKFGKQIDTWRTALSVNYENSEGNALASILLQADKGIFENLFQKSQYQPYLGFNLGILQHKEAKSNLGYGYGLNTGITYIFNHDFDLDLGYRIMRVNQIDNINTMKNLTLSLHYFY